MDNWKYQFSIKLDDGSIYVVRTNSREELEDEIIYIKGLITNWRALDITEQNKIIEERKESVNPIDKIVEGTEICEQHLIPMKKNKNDKWYHREYKDGKARFCNGFRFGEWL